MRVGWPWATRFGEGLDFGGMHITLDGVATASLKNLAPICKEKECSAEFFTCLNEKRKITLCEHALRCRYG
jgi:hypothetical protein